MSTISGCFGIIPARYESSRFPGKPLADICGKPMFWHVWNKASKCPEMAQVVLATDSSIIMNAAEKLGVPAIMTADTHTSGTDRVLEAARKLNIPKDSVVVNIQGDEPCLAPEMLSELVSPFTDKNVRVTTLASPISAKEALSPDRVKVALAKDNRALYFSRSPIPFSHDGKGEYLLHIGLYGFRMEALETFASLPASPLEQRERLEQLRLLDNGISIHVTVTGHSCHGVDRPEDLDTAIKILEREQI
ncbi:3-deoxy-manno-octulosonate cytidylyltransferase (CMP-KDO synthetase) [Maridesulfovibrio ferrireducens]|uniref:3-deoxy-manno-octulosonate cytidylyltransferase n=1 Tax=Maridesulfovibrio ferrireducens TaxID=246191 RepID=A0A1G9JDD4_9BACT|nr:3-deoxy-manno-octulosonate cytidylyltransferase [Maridesulfovibrio ferrireducens]SDL35312.1 3-deoxy-manno-octulosonate cytidylyltransferase (CMP-KDO synthetase) [Maridesulfovibrio ferrireducens]